MGTDEANPRVSDSEAPFQWTVRRVRPVIVLWVVLVFVAFMVVAHFVFHSGAAVKALAIAAVGAVVATLPAVLERVEYRLTATGVEQRAIRRNDPRDFKEVCGWHELVRIVPMQHGFKFYRAVPETGSLRRFWNLHISDRYSGEIHAEGDDLERVLRIAGRKGIGFS